MAKLLRKNGSKLVGAAIKLLVFRRRPKYKADTKPEAGESAAQATAQEQSPVSSYRSQRRPCSIQVANKRNRKNMRTTKAVVVGVCGLCLAIQGALGSTLYGVGNYGVYTIDTTSLTVSPLFNPGITWFGAADGDDTRSFFATAEGGSLYRVDVVNHTASAIGSYSGPLIRELARDTSTGTLYGTDYSSLYRINTATGLASLVGSLNGPAGMWALEFDSSLNKLVGVNQDNHTLYYIDQNTGVATAIGGTGQDRVTDIWYDATTGRTLGVGNGPGNIFQFNVQTGTASILTGLSPDPMFLGLGAPMVPEPGASLLLVLGGLSILVRPRRNS